MAAENGAFDVDGAIIDFLADTARTSLELPSLSAAQRKHAKILVEQHEELISESFGFGNERRLHVFKQKVADITPTACHDDSFEASMSTIASESDYWANLNDSNLDLPFSGRVLQVRNTFIHFDDANDDERLTQSLPTNMFRKRLFEESLQRQTQADVEGQIGKAPAQGDAILAPVACSSETDLQMHTSGQEFSCGTEVLIEGLLKCPAFNGLRGDVQCFDQVSGRYTVLLNLTSGQQTAKVKTEHLRRIEA